MDGEAWDEEIVGRRMVLVSWDVRTARRPLASWVNKLVYGREVEVGENGTRRRYRYPGYVDAPGVTRIGQSVLLMPPGTGRELAGKLEGRRIPCALHEVFERMGPARRAG